MTADKHAPDRPDRKPSPENAPPPARGENGDAQEKQDEKIRREQATKPALMPIGDPAGAA